MLDLAFAKLNLSLNVGAYDGKFHAIDSVVVTVDCCDVVKVKKNKRKTVTLRGCKDIPLRQNTAYIAACEFMRRFDTSGCDIKICKKIPVGAGMGGSSADAASVVRCLCKLYGVDVKSPEVHRLCADIGSDINFLLFGGLARITGKGDDLDRGSLPKNLYFVVTTFDVTRSAKEVYAAFDKIGSDVAPCDNDKLFALLREGGNAIGMFSNMLQSAAKPDYAAKYLQFCAERSFACHMTGSGSAFYVAFDNFEEAASAEKLLRKHLSLIHI